MHADVITFRHIKSLPWQYPDSALLKLSPATLPAIVLNYSLATLPAIVLKYSLATLPAIVLKYSLAILPAAVVLNYSDHFTCRSTKLL